MKAAKMYMRQKYHNIHQENRYLTKSISRDLLHAVVKENSSYSGNPNWYIEKLQVTLSIYLITLLVAWKQNQQRNV